MLALTISPGAFIAAASCIVLLCSLFLAIYRLFFHPLAGFPGPKLAAFTKWYEFYFDILKGHGGQYAFEIKRLHGIYGPIIRINPEEIHVDDPLWHATLYASNPTRRDKWPPAAKMVGAPLGTFGTVDHDVHRKRRAANSGLHSVNAVTNAESMVQEQVERLSDIFQICFEKGEVLELRTTFLAFTTDTVSLHALGQSMGLQSDERRAQEWSRTIRAVAKLTPLLKQFPWFIDVLPILPVSAVHWIMPDLARLMRFQHDMRSHARQFWITYKNISDFEDNNKEPSLAPLFLSICESSVPESEKEVERLAQEGFVMISAGGETTSRVLSMAIFHIVSNPRVLERLRNEIMMVMPDAGRSPSVKALEELIYLRAVVKEVLRVSALITSRSPLVAHKELFYRTWRIPSMTPAGMTIHDVLFDSNIFKDPYTFTPERWLEESSPNDRYFVPFGKGTRMCQGMRFAYTELYLTITMLLRRFEIQLYDTVRERDIDFTRDYFIGESHPESPGVRVKIVGKRS